jgi:hypothetical protein
MKGFSRAAGIALLWLAPGTVPALAQEAGGAGEASVLPAPVGDVALAQDTDEQDRAALRSFLARSEVATAARIGGVDLGRIERGLHALEGAELHRAAEQARAIEGRLGESSGADVISIQVTTLIIILLLVIIVILIA